MDHRIASFGITQSPADGLFKLGEPALDRALQGGLARASLHEVLADATPATAAIGFALALALRVLDRKDHLVWVRQEAAMAETGCCYGPGFVEFGGEPQRLTLIRLRTAIEVLRAGNEAARCPAIGAVILETTDPGNKTDLTATRRLKLAAEKSGVTIFLVRAAQHATPSAAQSRWLVRAAASRTWSAREVGLARGGGPASGVGPPCFDMTLLKHRAGLPEMRWFVEWNHDRHSFAEALSQPLVSLPQRRPLAA